MPGRNDSGRMRSATTLMTVSTRSRRPSMIRAGLERATRRWRSHTPLRADHVDQSRLVLEVEKRDPLRGRRPLPVGDHPGDGHA